MNLMAKLIRASLIIAFITFAVFLASGQGFKTCKVKSSGKVTPKFKIGRFERTINGPPTLLVQIGVPPERINRDDLIALAHHLKLKFCNEDRVDFVIFDNDRYAKYFSPISENHYYLGGLESMRGGYYFDRSSGLDEIEFTAGPNYFKNADGRIKINIQISAPKAP